MKTAKGGSKLTDDLKKQGSGLEQKKELQRNGSKKKMELISYLTGKAQGQIYTAIGKSENKCLMVMKKTQKMKTGREIINSKENKNWYKENNHSTL